MTTEIQKPKLRGKALADAVLKYHAEGWLCYQTKRSGCWVLNYVGEIYQLEISDYAPGVLRISRRFEPDALSLTLKHVVISQGWKPSWSVSFAEEESAVVIPWVLKTMTRSKVGKIPNWMSDFQPLKPNHPLAHSWTRKALKAFDEFAAVNPKGPMLARASLQTKP